MTKLVMVLPAAIYRQAVKANSVYALKTMHIALDDCNNCLAGNILRDGHDIGGELYVQGQHVVCKASCMLSSLCICTVIMRAAE